MMKFKKCLIFICLIVCMFTIASVCASDVNDTIVANDDQSDEVISIENSDNDEISVTEESELSAYAGTFKDLANDIGAAGDEFILTKNYTYSTGDSSYDGITINKNITIDGNGFTINGNNQARAFNIDSTNVILKNITFMNCKSNNEGGAIYWYGSNGVVSNCSFVNNSASGYGGAIYGYYRAVNGTISGCTFTNNSADEGGAIYWDSVNGTVSGCTFTDNIATWSYGYGGAIYWWGVNGVVSNCSFVNNSANYGGAIYWYGDNGVVSNCSFVNNSASWYGGAIYWMGYNGAVSDCSFVNNSANVDGGVIYWMGYNGAVSDCSFVNNSANVYGGAICMNVNDGFVSGCSFVNNSADYGGAIYTRDVGVFNNCIFTGNNGQYTIDSNCDYNCDYNWWGSNNPDLNNLINKKPTYCVIANLICNGCDYIVRLNQIYNINNGKISDFDNETKLPARNVTYTFSDGKVIIAPVGVKIYYEGPLVSAQIDDQTLYDTRAKSVMTVFVPEKPVSGSTIIVILFSDAEGNITLSIAGENSMFNLVDGIANASVPDIVSGNYSYVILYTGGDKYAPLVKKGNLTVEPRPIDDNDIIIPPLDDAVGKNVTVKLPDDATGTIILSIEGKDYRFDVVNGTAIVKVPELANGVYTYVIAYSGDSKYAAFTKTGTMTVNIIIETIIVNDMTIEYGSGTYFNATFLNSTGSPLVDKYITFEVDGNPYSFKTDSEGLAVLNIDLTPGTYTITSINQITDEKKTNTLTVIYGPNPIKKSIIVASDITMTYGDETNLTATLTDENGESISEVEISIVLNGKTIKNTTDDNGQVKLLIDLMPAIYTAEISFEGNEIYESSNKTIKIVVNKIDCSDVEIPDEIVNDDVTISFDLPSDATGTVTMSFNNKTYTTTVNNGKVNIDLSDLKNGNYPYTITYSGDKKYASFTKTGSLTVKPQIIDDKDIDISLLDGATDESLTVKLPSDVTGTVILTIGGKDYRFDVVNGTAIVKVPELANGGYTYVIAYSGDSRYSSFNRIGNLNVINPKIAAKDTSVQYLAKGKYSVTVYGYGGKVASGVEVIFKIAGVQVAKVKTDAKGVASYVVTKKPGTYKISASALGKTVTKKLTVKHAVTLKSVKVKKSAKKLVLKATVKVGKKPIAKKKVTFKFKGKKYTAKTNKKGIAKVTVKKNVLKKLKVGKKVKYQATYLKDTVKKTAKVKK